MEQPTSKAAGSLRAGSQPHRWQRHLLPLAVWTLCCALFFGTILTGRERLPGGDLSGQFHAYALFQAREMAQGRLPTWSPGSYGGVPFGSDPQAAVFYPPRWLTILVSLPWGLTYLALEIEAILHIWLAGVFTYALAYTITQEPLAALVGAVAFSLGGYLTSYPMLQLAILESIAWLPLALLFLRLGVVRDKPVPYLVGAGLALGLSALAGHPQTFLHISYLAVVYYLFLAIRQRWSWGSILSLGALVGITAVGVSCAALLPAWRYLQYTTRREVTYEFVASGLPMLDYVQVLVVGALSKWSPQYIGLAGALLAAFALLKLPEASRAEIAFWGSTAFVAAWLALGDAGVLFELVYRVAPGFAMFQGQERLLGLFSLAMALLATQGAASWLRSDAASLRLRLGQAGGMVACLLVLAGLILAITSGTAAQAWPGIWLRQLALLVAMLALLSGVSRRRDRALAVIALLGVDLYLSALGAINRQRGSPNAYWPQPVWVQALRSAGPARIDSSGLFYANLGEAYGLEDIHGISPLRPQALVDLGKLPPTRRWQLLNVAYVLAGAPPADASLTPVAEIDQSLIPGEPFAGTLYAFDDALPRAWMSYQPLVVPDSTAALGRLAEPAFDPATQVVLLPGGEGSGVIGPPPAGHGPQIDIRRLGPGGLEIQVDTEGPGFLVISEWWYPGWQARLDGAPVPLLRADYALQAVRVPAGRHTVVTRYVPALEYGALAFSLLMLLAMGLVAWRWRPTIGHREARVRRAAEGVAMERGRWRQTSVVWQCVAVVLAGFAFRALHACLGELRGDEAFSYLMAHLPFSQILPELLRQGELHSPLHYWLLHICMRGAGTSEFVMRFASLVPGVLLLPVAYQLGRRMAGARAGILLAGLMAASQSLVWAGQDARSHYTLVMLFLALSTLLLLRAAERPTWRNWGAYAIACALVPYSHYYGVFALLGHGLYLAATPALRRRLWAWGASCALAGLAFLPWLLATLPGLTLALQLAGPGHPELAGYLTSVGTELAVGMALGQPVGRWVFLGGLALAWAGVRGLRSGRPGWAAMLVGWLTGAALAIFLLIFRRSTLNAYYILVAAVPWWALVTAGITWLWRRQGRLPRALAVLSLVGLVGANGISLGQFYFNPSQDRVSGYRQVAAHLAAQAGPGDVFVRNFPDPCYDYYLEGVSILRTIEPPKMGASPEEADDSLRSLAARYDRIWFAQARGLLWDPQGLAYNWLECNALLEQETLLDHIALLAYRPLHSASQAMLPTDQVADGLLRLKGTYVLVDGKPADLHGEVAIPPGATVKVTLLWQALGKIGRSYTVFVHLLGEDNRLVAQHDGLPLFGTRPTWLWSPGEEVLDRHDFAVPADVAVSRATVLVGIYESDTVVRCRFGDARDAIPIAAVLFRRGESGSAR